MVLQFWRPEVQNQGAYRVRLLAKTLGGGDGDSFLASSSFWGLQALLDIPYLVAAALRSLLQVSWPSSPCVSKSPSIRTLVTGFRGHWSLDLGPTVTWFRLILTNHICKDPISKCGHILSFPVNVNFEGDIFQPGLVLIQNQRVFQNI